MHYFMQKIELSHEVNMCDFSRANINVGHLIFWLKKFINYMNNTEIMLLGHNGKKKQNVTSDSLFTSFMFAMNA